MGHPPTAQVALYWPYGFGLIAVALAISVRLALDPLLGLSYPYATLFVAVLATASSHGTSAGLLALLAGELAVNYFLLPPRFSFALHSRDDVVGLVVDALVGLTIALVAGALHEARRRQQHSMERIQNEQLRLTLTLDGLSEAVLSTDELGRVSGLNTAAERLTGHNRQAVLGRPINEILVSDGDSLRRNDGSLVPVAIRENRLALVRDRSDVATVWILRDLTEQNQLLDAKRELAQHAALERERVAVERERQLQIVIAQAPIAIAMLDANLHYIVASKNWSSYFALGEQQLTGRSHFDLFPNVDARWQEMLQRCLAGALERAEEEAVVRPDGTTAWYRWEIQPWSRTPAGVDGIIIYSEDITPRKVAHEALRRSEERLRLIIEAASDYAIYMLDVQGRIVTWNAGAGRMLGYSADAIIGKHFSMFHLPEDDAIDLTRRALETAAGSGRWAEEGWCVRHDGTRFWAEGVLTPVREQEALVGFVNVVRDVTERRRSQELQRAVIDNAFDTIVSINEHGVVESFNGAGERLFGYRSEEVVGENVKLLMPEPYRSEHDQYLSRYMRTGEAKIIGIGRQVTGRRKDGRLFPVELSITEFSFDSERHFTGILRDLTDRQKLEDQLRQATKMEAVGRLAGGVAHDFNNILFVILGYGTMLLDASEPQQRGYQELKELVAAAERASELTRQLLMFSRHHQLEAQVIDPQEVLANLHRMLSRLVGENIRVRHEGPPISSRVRIPRNHLEQVVMNLVVNARDAMPHGGDLELSVEDVQLDEHYAREHLGAKPGNYAALHVRDTGLGMDEHVKARIFEPFFTTKPSDKGTGLGLSMVLNIVQQAGGCVSVRSQPGEGTTFSVFLPADPGSVIRSQDPITVKAAPSTGETVLLVEDEGPVRQVATRILEGHGYHVLHAINGSDALQRFAHPGVNIDLLLTDVVMPQVDGFRLAQQMRRQRPALRVLFMSGYTDDTIARSSGFKLTSHNFLPKPTTPDALLMKVREVLDRDEELPSSMTA